MSTRMDSLLSLIFLEKEFERIYIGILFGARFCNLIFLKS
jgi:hypothetical protein